MSNSSFQHLTYPSPLRVSDLPCLKASSWSGTPPTWPWLSLPHLEVHTTQHPGDQNPCFLSSSSPDPVHSQGGSCHWCTHFSSVPPLGLVKAALIFLGSSQSLGFYFSLTATPSLQREPECPSPFKWPFKGFPWQRIKSQTSAQDQGPCTTWSLLTL